MRVYDIGFAFNVTVSAREVEAFKSRWPCSGLRSANVAFQFDKRGGDLIDFWCRGDRLFSFSLEADSTNEALAALADDAKAFGVRKLGLTL